MASSKDSKYYNILLDYSMNLKHKEMSIMKHIRVKYGSEKPNALISRSICGLMNTLLVYVLPGSVKAVTEYMNEIIPTIDHSLKMIFGINSH